MASDIQNDRGIKRAWILCQYAKPPSMSGSMRQFEHAQILKQFRWDVRVIATPYKREKNRMQRPVTLLKPRHDADEDGVEFTWVYTTPYTGNNWRRYLNMISFLISSQLRLKGEQKPDVVVGSSPHLFAALGGWITARRFRAGFVFEVRDLWPESLIQLGLTNPVIIKPLELLEKFLYKQADAITCLTDGIADSIKTRIDDPEKVVVLPNAVMSPQPVDPVQRTETRNRLGWSESEVIAIYAGAHGDANDLDQIVNAARELSDEPSIRFVLFGGGPTKARLKERSKDLSNITFHDSVTKSEIGDILRAADIGLMTLKAVPLFEGARPNKLFDYMGAGLASISTIRGEAENVLLEAKSGIGVDPSDLAVSIRDLANDGDRRRSMGQSGLNYMAEGENRETVANRFAALLDGLIGKNVKEDRRPANDAG